MYLSILVISGVIIFLTVIYSVKWIIKDRKGFGPKLSLIGSLIAFFVFLSEFEEQKLQLKLLELTEKQKNNLEILSQQTLEKEKKKKFDSYADKLKKLHTILEVSKKNTELTLSYFKKSPDLITEIIYEKDNIYPIGYYEELNNPIFFGYLDDCAIENFLEIESYMHDIFNQIDYKLEGIPCSQNQVCIDSYELILSEYLRYIDLSICLVNSLTINFTYEDICIAQEECEAQSRENAHRRIKKHILVK